MKYVPLLSASLLTLGVAAAAHADTLKKVADSGKLTLAYRESSVPFSYLISPTKPVGFAVDLTEAIIDDVRTTLKKKNLEVAYMPVTGQTRIPLLVNGTYDLECGSTTNNSARGKEVTFAISHFFTGTRLLAKKSSGIKNYADLANKTVASTAGSTNEKVLRAYGVPLVQCSRCYVAGDLPAHGIYAKAIGDAGEERRHQRLALGLRHQHIVRGDAGLAGIEELAEGNRPRRRVDIGARSDQRR